MLEQTLARFADAQRFDAPLVLTNEALRFAVAAQLGTRPATVILEPAPRNTAPALAAAALIAAAKDREAVILAVPSDHVIGRLPAFLAQVAAALPAAQSGRLVTFAVVPTRAETGYGYIRRGKPLPGQPEVFDVAAFVEKPDLERARRFIAAGDYFWNSGMFLFRADSFLTELEQHAPQVLAAAREAVAAQSLDGGHLRLGAAAFAAAPAVSVDHAVMEHSSRAATIPCDMGWTDLGGWAELWSVGAKDDAGNVVVGDVLAEGVRDCYLRSEHRLVAALGVEGLVVVETADAVLVMPRDRAQDTRLMVEHLRKSGRQEGVAHRDVARPWGSFQSIQRGNRFQVKLITVRPGAKLSLQLHYHRAEHWVVVNGTALVTCGDHTSILRENESIYIPAGTQHRLENPGRMPLNLIEVQTGGYLEEDDIVRSDDCYGRSPR